MLYMAQLPESESMYKHQIVDLGTYINFGLHVSQSLEAILQ